MTLTRRPFHVTLPLTFASHSDRAYTARKNARGSGKTSAVAGPKLPIRRSIHHACPAYSA